MSPETQKKVLEALERISSGDVPPNPIRTYHGCSFQTDYERADQDRTHYIRIADEALALLYAEAATTEKYSADGEVRVVPLDGGKMLSRDERGWFYCYADGRVIRALDQFEDEFVDSAFDAGRAAVKESLISARSEPDCPHSALDGCDCYAKPQQPAAELTQPQLPSWWPQFWQNVLELPDRNSPEDEPEAIVATASELESCAMRAIEHEFETSTGRSVIAPAGATRFPEALRLAVTERCKLQNVHKQLQSMVSRYEGRELCPALQEIVSVIDEHLATSPQLVYALPPISRATLLRWRELLLRDLEPVIADMDRMPAGMPPLLHVTQGWLPPLRPMASAPRDREPVLLKFRDNLTLLANETRDSLHGFAGRYFVGRRECVPDGQNIDMGWSFAAPVGVGGFDEYLLEGWLPLPATQLKTEGAR